MAKSIKPGTSYRDSFGLIRKDGGRVWMYPKKVSGFFHKYRQILAWVLIGIFIGLPLIQVNGQPFMLLNFLDRKFIILGKIFWPQDSYIFFVAMITFILFIILFTVIYGRLWCGWACPQTIFMEMVYRKVEYLIEGDAYQQRVLAKQAWNFEKISKKAIKHIAFWIISFIIASTLVAYLVGLDHLIFIFQNSLGVKSGTFAGLLIFSTVLYFIYSQVREIVCTVICPYGRLQGVLVDKNTMVVAYDYIRGEPRGPMKSDENRAQAQKGDCVACHACVQVCPTGIDIRNGSQFECVACTACIDACDATMTKNSMKPGLIRFASESQISENQPFTFTPRVKAYSLVLLVLVGFFTFLLLNRANTETTILRTSGLLFQKLDDGRVSNLYNIKVLNKTFDPIRISIKPVNLEGEIQFAGSNEMIVPGQKSSEGVFFLKVNPALLNGKNTNVEFAVYANDELIENQKLTFIGPE